MKADIWSLGICILSAANLLDEDSLIGINENGEKLINDYI